MEMDKKQEIIESTLAVLLEKLPNEPEAAKKIILDFDLKHPEQKEICQDVWIQFLTKASEHKKIFLSWQRDQEFTTFIHSVFCQ